jgi:diacylglycerol kinase (ATP)
MKWLAIINPYADHHTPEQLEALARDLREQVGAECVYTSHPKHACTIARNSEGYNGVIAVGGDGTISEVINCRNGAISHLGFIPAGTGNGLARDLGLNDERGAVRALRRPRFAWLDLIALRYRCASGWQRRLLLSTSAIGYVAGATELAMGPLKRLNRIRYPMAAFLQAWRQREFAARIRFDDGPWEEHTLTSLAVHNTQYVGPFWLFPEARVDDGKLDVLLGRLSSVGQLVEDLAILTKTFFFVHSERRQARQVEIELAEPNTLMADGDLLRGVEALAYEVLPGRLCCCIGAARPRDRRRRKQEHLAVTSPDEV